jgi:HAD superfamily hydrolase (TIGR01458 family)
VDIDGVLAVSWEPVPGAVEAIKRFRHSGLPFRLITNTTTHTRAALADQLRKKGFEVNAHEIVTAVNATATYLRENFPDSPTFVLTDGDPSGDMEGVRLAEAERADVIVIGGACDAFAYPVLNRVFRRVMEGAALIGMHRNLYWRTADGLELDGGAYIAALEQAAGIDATICGKPSPTFFRSSLTLLELSADRTAMVGDDITNDVLGAQAIGITGVLVRTGKFRESDLARGKPDHVVDSIADVPNLFRRA